MPCCCMRAERTAVLGMQAKQVWLKGKQVQILYELVTVIRGYGFEYWSLMYCKALGRPNLYVDLSARKPASCLVPDIFQNHELLIVLFFRLSVLIIEDINALFGTSKRGIFIC